MEKKKPADVVRLPSEMSYLGHFPEFNIANILVRCKFCNLCLIPQALQNHLEQCVLNPVNKTSDYKFSFKRSASDIDAEESEQNELENSLLCKYNNLDVKPSALTAHLEQSPGLSTTSTIAGTTLSVVNTSAHSEIDTSSTNSSPIWESDKNNIYDSCVSSSSSNSVNIVRLKQEKHKYRLKNNVIPIPLVLSDKKVSKTPPEAPFIKQNLLSSQTQISSSQKPKVLSLDTISTASNSHSTADNLFECRSFFEAVQPSTSIQESSAEGGKSKLSIIIRRVPNQNSSDVRRVPVEKENTSQADNLRCFLVSDENSRTQNVKVTKHPVKKKICDGREIKTTQGDKRHEHLRASQQQIAFLTRRIETLNRQIESLTGQVGPLRLENEEYKAEIRNLRGRVEELETSTNSLIEQKNIRAKNDKKIEELKQSWERERFLFTQHLEELQTELSDYKNSSSLEKQKLTILNAYLERKFGLQEALTENIQKEKEILERHIPPNIRNFFMNELLDLQRSRNVIYSLLNGSTECLLSNPPTLPFSNVAVEQLPLSSRQLVDMSSYLPLDISAAEMAQGNNRQLLNIFNLSDNKIQYQGYSNEATNKKEKLDLKKEESSSSAS